MNFIGKEFDDFKVKALQVLYDKFKGVGAEIYSCSEDTEFVHKAW